MKYSLSVVSQNPETRGQKLTPYFVEGLQTVGVFGNEPFSLRFRNHTAERVQVRFSIDGTDILTAQPATTATTGKMWLVEAYGTLTLDAWPETNEKGARFVFGAVGDSVAAHTHGDVSMKGIIGAAVFEEKNPPVRVYRGFASASAGSTRSRVDYHLDSFLGEAKTEGLVDTVELCAFNAEAGPAVGAGELVKQALTTVKGLEEPKLTEILTMRYVWFDTLKEKLNGSSRPYDRPTGFRNPPEEKLANLGTTPRPSSSQEVKRTEVEVQRTSW